MSTNEKNNHGTITYKNYKKKENVFWLDDFPFQKIRRLEDIIYTDIIEPFYTPLAIDHDSFVCLYNCYTPNKILVLLFPEECYEDQEDIMEQMERALVDTLIEHNIPCKVNQKQKLVPPFPEIPHINMKNLNQTYKVVGVYECTIDLASNNIKEAMIEGLEKGQIELKNKIFEKSSAFY